MLGSRLGPYRLLCELGTGAMGTVYRATVVDEAPAGIPRGSCVAIKVIHPHLLRRPGYARRFLREVRIGQRVTHPNVVRTYEGGSVPEGRRTRLYLRRLEVQTALSEAMSSALLPEDVAKAGLEGVGGLAEARMAVVLALGEPVPGDWRATFRPRNRESAPR